VTDDHLLLETVHLGRRRPGGSGWLLRDVAAQVRSGQRIALVGPSGAGKTLLLRALAMLDQADTGEIRWKGRMITGSGVPSYRSRAMYLHQRPELIEGTVERFLRQPFALRIHRDRAFHRDRVVSFLDAMGRGESFLEKPGCDLSGGEGQMVMLIRALQLNPQLLLLDEPTSALDSRTVGNVEQLVIRWVQAEAHRAFIWVSHDTSQSRRVADDLWRIKGGRLV